MLNRLLSLAYWAEATPGVLSLRARILYLALGAAFALGMVASCCAWRARFYMWVRQGRWLCLPKRLPRAFWAAEALLCALGLMAVVLRLAERPGWLARGWVAAPAALAFGLGPALVVLAPSWPALWRGWRDAWAFRPSSQVLRPLACAAFVALHGAALVVSVRLACWPLRTAAALLVALLAPGLVAGLLRTGRPCSAWGLYALTPAYLIAGAEAAQRLALRLGWLAERIALPLAPALATLYVLALAYQLYAAWPDARRALAWAPAALLGAAGLAWGAWAYFTLYAGGVSGSDPYCYVQMAVDLLRHGTLLHRFPLAAVAGALQIDPEPLLHVGYRLPVDAAGWAATVWPAGHSVLLALAGRLGGEPTIYLATPLMALASIAATIWLGGLLCDDLPAPLAWCAGGLAGFLVATSFEQLRWVLVHMADVSAQLFSTLTVALAWLGATRGRRRYYALAGLALAMAYWTRHTQLAMALPVLALVGMTGAGRAKHARLPGGVAFLGAALLGALPDLAYHTVLLGSPFRPESKELSLYALRAVPATTILLVREWLAAPELLFLAPFLLAGALALARRNRRAAIVLALWLLGLWAVQAPYISLRTRDLLPALPALALVAAYGVARALSWTARHWRAGATLLALAVVALLWLRSVDTLMVPWLRNFNNFGYLWPTQCQEFAALQSRLEPGAAVGATLNSGAVDLYGARETFLPALWQPDDLRTFLQALWQAGRPTYLLDDGTAMAQVLADVQAYARLSPAATLRLIPYYAPDGGSELRDVVLYRVEARP